MKKNRWIIWLLLFVCLILPLPENRAQASDYIKAGEVGIPGATGEALPRAKTSVVRAGRTAVKGFSYGSQLTSANEKAIYNALKNANDMRSYTNGKLLWVTLPSQYTFTRGATFSKTAQWKTLYRELSRVLDAYYMDYCEDYWVGGFSLYVNGDCQKIGKFTKIGLEPIDYYSGIRSELSMTDAEMQKAINSIGGSSRYEVVKKAHDYVLDLISYPSITSAASDYPYYHVINGGLLGKYGHKGVCDSYARLFHLLCRSKGIPSILVVGGNESDTSGNIIDDHIWNYVQMEDGKWYLVDCTWDDNIYEDIQAGYDYGDYGKYTYFLAGSTAAGLDGSVGEEHMTVGVLSTEVSYTPFTLPALSANSYVYNGASVTDAKTISLNCSSASLKCGQMKELNCVMNPSNAEIFNLKWSSSDNRVVEISTIAGRAVIRAKKAGTAVIRVTNGTLSASCRVTVSHVPQRWKVVKKATCSQSGEKVKKCSGCGVVLEKMVIPQIYVKLNASCLPLQRGKSTTALKIASHSEGDHVKSWKSSNTKVVTVNRSGKLTAKKKGTAVITVTMNSGAKASCKVKVQDKKVRTQKLTLKQNTATLAVGKSMTMIPVRTPVTATDKITFKSSNKKVATVSSKGKIVAKRKGKATITAKVNGKKVSLVVTVK